MTDISTDSGVAVWSPGEIEAEFYARISNPTQRQLDLLIGDLAIPVMALARDHDGGGCAVGMIYADRRNRRFEFIDEPEPTVKPIVGLIAFDRDDEAQDIVGWSPRDGWSGTWLGRAALLGEHVLDQYRADEPLRAFLDVGAWLQASRHGVVVLNGARAWRVLEGVRLEAEGIEDRVALRKALTPPRPDIVVRRAPANAERVAA